MRLKTFLYGSHPNEPLRIKVSDQTKGLFIKITWCKIHVGLFLGHCKTALTALLCGGHPNHPVQMKHLLIKLNSFV